MPTDPPGGRRSKLRRPLIRPWQPMKPTWVRATSGESPSCLTRTMSNPGAWKPLHDTVTRWVISTGGIPASSRDRAAAATAKPPADASYCRIRVPVDGFAAV